MVDTRDRQVARAVLTAAGFEVGAGPGGVLELTAESAVAHPDDIASLLVREGIPPTRLSVEQEDLEAHFLRLVGLSEGGAK